MKWLDINDFFFHFFHFSRPGARPADGNLTAASLIDAIITHQISQSSTEPPGRDGHRAPFVSFYRLYSLIICITY